MVKANTIKHKLSLVLGSIIDTPGEYIENPNYYRGIILNSYDADIVIFMNEAGEGKYFPS